MCSTTIPRLRIALIIRGHERNVTSNPHFRDLLSRIAAIHDLHLYIHTWDQSEATRSWRPLSPHHRHVSEEDIIRYFQGFDIRYLCVDNESSITLVGNTVDGFLCHAPIRGWKYMWWGKCKVAEQLKNNNQEKYDMALNIRFDIYRVAESNHHEIANVSFDKIINLINEYYHTPVPRPLRFLIDHAGCCVDNLYVGTCDGMYMLANHFHTQLDDIVRRFNRQEFTHLWCPNHEKIVFLESRRLSWV